MPLPAASAGCCVAPQSFRRARASAGDLAGLKESMRLREHRDGCLRESDGVE